MAITHQDMVKQYRTEHATGRQASEVRQQTMDFFDTYNSELAEIEWKEQQAFETELERKEKIARFEKVLPPATVPEKTAPVMTPPAEPELSDKDQKKKRKAAEKNLKKGQKLTANATEYTVPILEAEKKREKKQTPPHSDVPEDKLLAHVTAIKINAYEFTPAYIGEHFEEVFRKVSDYRRWFAAYGGDDAPGADGLNEDQKIQRQVMRETYLKIEAAFRSALSANGLKEVAEGRIEPDPDANTAEAATGNAQDVESLKEKLLAGSEEKERLRSAKVDEFYQLPPISEEMQIMQDHYELDYGIISKCRSKESYEEMLPLKKAVGDFADTSESDEAVELASKLYYDFELLVREADLLAAQHETATGRLQGADETLEVTKAAKKRQEEVRTRYDLLARRKDMLKAGIKHLTEGTPLPEAAAVLLSEKYGYVDPAFAAQKKTLRDSTLLYMRINAERQQLFEDAVKRVYPNENPDAYLKGTTGRMVMLMRNEDDEYNEAICMLAKEVNMLQQYRSTDQRATDEYRDFRAAVGRDMAEVTTPLFQQIMDFDTRRITDASDEDLIAMQEEIIQMNLAGQMVTDLGKHVIPPELTEEQKKREKEELERLSPAEREARIKQQESQMITVKDRYLGKPDPLPPDATKEQKAAYEEAMMQYDRRHAVFQAKCTLIQGAMMRARGAAMLKAQKHVTLEKKDVMAEVEIIKTNGQLAGDTEHEQCLSHARKLYEGGAAQFRSGLQRLASDEGLVKYHYEHEVIRREGVHDGVTDPINDLLVKSSRRQKAYTDADPKAPVDSGIRELIDERMRLIGELNGILTSDQTGPEDAIRIRERIAAAADEIDTLKMIKVLMLSDFKLVGDKERLINEAIFRAFGSFEMTDAARTLNDRGFKTMIRQLAAEAFLPENPSEEEVEAAKQEQMRGLRTYYDAIRVNYNRMEDLFGTKGVPDLAFIVEHWEQIDQLGANVQVDVGLVSKDRRTLKMDNPADERLWHQVEYFNAFIGACKHFKTMNKASIGSSGKVNAEEVKEQMKMFLGTAEEHRQFLIEHPRA
ncbi:MAG: hypothetical protein K6F53_07995 [Lachnospiraceae bacterium]|nr:hypothetical protein [Lachnospiraceae bacterium]